MLLLSIFCSKRVFVSAAVQWISHIFAFQPIITENLDRVLSELVPDFVLKTNR